MTSSIYPQLNTAIGSILPPDILTTICKYTQHPFRTFVNLTDKETLKELIAHNSDDNLRRVMEIAKKIYEVPKKKCIVEKRGFIFTADAEVLAYAMAWIKEQTGRKEVCEIGCASGENGLMLLHAGADKVIFNEAERLHLADLETQIKTLPKDLESRCTVIEGNCFDLLQTIPNLRGRINLLLCRNLFHFIKKIDHASFVALINDLLAPGGKAIFTANSLYGAANGNEETLKKYHGHTYMNEVHGVLYNSLTNKVTNLFSEITSAHEPAICGPCQEEIELYTHDVRENVPSNYCVSNWKKVNPALKDKIKEKTSAAIKKILVGKTSLAIGGISLLSYHSRVYDFQSITDVFEKHSLPVETTFLVDDKGHNINDFSTQPKRGQIGVIVQKSYTQAT